MHFRVRDLDPDGKFTPQLKLELLAQVVPRPAIQAVFADLGLRTQRQRKLSLEGVLWLVMGMNLFPNAALEDVWEQLAHGLRRLWPDDAERLALLPSKSAFTDRRDQLGVRPLRQLFQRIARPLATPATPGAFLGGLRLMAMDGHTEAVPDTPENAAVFGRHTTDRGDSAYPQVLCVSLCGGSEGKQCATHAMIPASGP